MAPMTVLRPNAATAGDRRNVPMTAPTLPLAAEKP